MLWDNHMHTSFSGDSTATPEAMIQSAIEKKLSGITITDHLDIDYTEHPHLFDLDIPTYYKEISDLSKKYSSNSFELLKGIEIGLRSDLVEQNTTAIAGYDFDYVIGSTHVVDKIDPYYPTFWEKGDANMLCHRYYEVILENIIASPFFDSLGHLDYLFRYVPNEALKEDTYTPYADIIDEILNLLIKKDKALEINTGIFKKNASEPNPGIKIIKRYKELNGKLITIGADAHEPKHVAIGYEKTKDILTALNFSSYYVYKERKPVEYPIGFTK